MNTFNRHRFPPDIISYAVWLYYRFKLRKGVEPIFQTYSLAHRVGNSGPDDLVFVEIQTGEFLTEDDIQQFASKHGRAQSAAD